MTPEVIPPRVPQFNWVDLGLPSGTLWLDRLVGAPSPSEPGLYYQWGAVNGHTATDGYNFDDESYIEQGLDAINSNLTESQDAARAFYGPAAKMPSEEQVQELIQNTSIQNMENSLRITSLINGESIVLYKGGCMVENSVYEPYRLYIWLSLYHDSSRSYSLINQENTLNVSTAVRTFGLPVMAVHS